MPLAYIALPIAFGLVGAVAITVILVEVIPRVLEDQREQREKANRRRTAGPVRAQSHSRAGAGENERSVRSSGARREGGNWGYEIRKRRGQGRAVARNSGDIDEEDESRLLLQPILTRQTSGSPQHVLSNPSDVELSSPDVEISRRRIQPTTTTPLIPIDEEVTSKTTSIEAEEPTLVPFESIPTTAPSFSLLDTPSTPRVDAHASPATLFESPKEKDKKSETVESKLSSTTSSTFSSPCIVDQDLHSLENSPSFSDIDTFVGIDPEGEEREAPMRRSETGKPSSAASDDGSWFKLSDDEEDGAESHRARSVEGEEEGRNVMQEWEEIGERKRKSEQHSGLGLGFSSI